MKPLFLIYVFVTIFAVVGLPCAYLIDRDGLFFIILENVDKNWIFVAYFWTILSFLIFVLLNYILGSNENVRVFADKRIYVNTDAHHKKAWWALTGISLVLTILMLYQTDFKVPVLEGLRKDFITSIYLRDFYLQKVNQNLFTINLNLFATYGLILSLFFIRSKRFIYMLISISNLLLISLFNYTKFYLVSVLYFTLIYYSFVRKIRAKTILYAVSLAVGILFLFYYFASGLLEDRQESFFRILMSRSVYGNWVGLPFFLETFDNNRSPWLTIMPPYLKPGSSYYDFQGTEVPSRVVMREIVGDKAVDEGFAGVASTYFAGEAFALAGYLGIIVGVFLVSVELWIISVCFRGLKKTVFSTFVYVWFLLKISLGFISGASAFLISSFSSMIVLLMYWTFCSKVIALRRKEKTRYLLPSGR